MDCGGLWAAHTALGPAPTPADQPQHRALVGLLLLLKGAQKCRTPSASCSISRASECSGRTAENGRSSSHVRAGPAKRCHIDLNEPKTKEQRETRTSQPGKVVAHSQDPTRPRITEAHLPGLRHILGREASGNPADKGDRQSTSQWAEGSIQA